ncbi:MAG: WG repeat-containing protein [Azoarcus sp.]|jgi:hypothetical protein|nr:WG repeat-containing protein [Azoarcus sp.]
MKYRVPIFAAVLVITAILLFVAQPWMASVKDAAYPVECDKVRQCLAADFAWPPKLLYCPATLAPLTVRQRSEEGKWGYAMDYGRCSQDVLVTPRYDDAEKFGNNGLAKVGKDGKWGFVNLKGEEVIPLLFEEAGDFDYGLVAVKSNGQWGYFNAQGQPEVPPSFEQVSGLWREGLSAVKQNGKWGFIDPKGEAVVETRYDEVSEFIDGVSKVKLNGKWGAVDTKGAVVVPPDYEVIISTAEETRLLIVAKNGLIGYFSTAGKEIIPPVLRKAVSLRRDGSGAIQARLNEAALSDLDDADVDDKIALTGWFYLDATNEKLRFDDAGKAQLWRKGEWYYVTPRGKLVKVSA